MANGASVHSCFRTDITAGVTPGTPFKLVEAPESARIAAVSLKLPHGRHQLLELLLGEAHARPLERVPQPRQPRLSWPALLKSELRHIRRRRSRRASRSSSAAA